jgi:H2-forming N5,N10-methylenetetrahydromethanopterin dehydrogenase-like enzyme
MLFIAGDSEDDSIIQEFVTKYGPELFSQVRQMVLQQIMPNAQTEGMIKGSLEGGMADDIPMTIGADTQAAVSQDEYIVPADVVSMIGDGSSDAGAKKLDGMLDNVRLEKGGTTKQARPLKKDIEEYVQ